MFLFERDERIGGHTHTVTVESSHGPLPVDTGFIVHNDRTYPNLIRLLAELGVPRVNSDMSFAVSCRRTGYEYSSRGLRGYFAQKRNVLNPGAYVLFGEIKRFNRIAPRLLDRPDAARVKLGDFLDEYEFTQFFREFYLFPMASAIWSCSQNALKEFPAAMLARFFHNHGMLTINGHPQWKTIPGGCSRYIAPIVEPYKHRVFCGVSIRSVVRDEQGVTLQFADSRPAMIFDHVVFARPATMTDHMNRLQALPVQEHYCVTLNANESIRPEKVLQRFVYHHPIFTLESMSAQRKWRRVSGVNRTHFCGAYWFYGFHEDGVNSALRVSASLGIRV